MSILDEIRAAGDLIGAIPGHVDSALKSAETVIETAAELVAPLAQPAQAIPEDPASAAADTVAAINQADKAPGAEIVAVVQRLIALEKAVLSILPVAARVAQEFGL